MLNFTMTFTGGDPFVKLFNLIIPFFREAHPFAYLNG